MWHQDYKHCQNCRRIDSKHMARGLCVRCYAKMYRNTPANRDRIVATKRDWYFRFHADNLLQRKEYRESRHFNDLREAVLQRDKHKCVRCQAMTRLVVHHKDHNGRGKPQPRNTLDNLETLCRRCHRNEHHDDLLNARHAKHATPKLNKHKRWSVKYDSCVNCKLTTSVHAAKGICSRCYQRKYNMT